MEPRDAEELARARLAYVSAGRPALCGPRRAAAEPVPEPVGPPAPPPPTPAPRSTGLPPRRTITLKHLWVVAILLLCGVGVAVAALARSSATEVPLPSVSVVSSPAAPVPSPSPTPMVRVHVAGAVLHPGVITLPEGSIVQDAIEAAGGLLPDADPAQLNLAAPVSEGMQVIIGTSGDPQGELNGASGAIAGGGSPGAVDLNSATVAELETLPGVGPVMAGAIVAWREENGRFTAVEELQEVSGIGPKTFEKLKLLVRV
ncbi:ComEA family DNA-binding protein [Tessaracoccus sp. MC1679]|uniref:ComEA family DNA-binding protein n=1 Tax=Tessaracoccus sp. MC1679 TaxID=2760313 RepID=UPI00160256F0|nr:ComEA family DNA-binding protein [Tessaracoccus sp. MC1679]MBB1515900.1 ComEA family DNA-binding protein [Tessaracoccus sp. MC1679]